MTREGLLAILKSDKPRKKTHAEAFGDDPKNEPSLYDWPIFTLEQKEDYYLTTVDSIGSDRGPNDDAEKLIELSSKDSMRNIFFLKKMDFDGKLWGMISFWIERRGEAIIVSEDKDLLEMAFLLFDSKAQYYDSLSAALKMEPELSKALQSKLRFSYQDSE